MTDYQMTYCLGTAVHSSAGWRFISLVASHGNSRKAHTTMRKCLPRWLGYPDRCESVAYSEFQTRETN